MRFSVVIPTFGRQAMLESALRSLIQQTHSEFECLVINDGSPDPVELPFRDSRFRVINRESNGGPAAARNTGLNHASGDAVAFLDDDDEFTPVRLADAAAMLGGADISFCGAGSVASENLPNHPNLSGNVHDVILNRTSPSLGTVAVWRDRCPRFDEGYPAGEDLDWLLKATQGTSAASTGSIGWLWRRHDGVRGRHGLEARIAASQMLMQRNADYFATHRKARAFRHHRIAVMSLQLGQRRTAIRAATKSLLDGRVAAAKPLARSILGQ